MRCPTTPWMMLLLAACGARITAGSSDTNSSTADAGTGTDADAAVAVADAAADTPPDALVLGAWSTPAKVTVAATSATEDDDTLSGNGLELIFAVTNNNAKDLYYTSRTALDAAWSTPVKLPFDDGSNEQTPRFSGDDLTLYFAADRTTSGNLDIYQVTRTAANNTSWGTPQLVAGLQTAALEKWLSPCTGGRYVVVEGPINGDTDLYEGTFGGGAPAPITALNTGNEELAPFVTQDCLTLYFSRKEQPRQRIYVSHRATVSSAWPAAVVVDDFKLTGTDNQEDPWLSADGRIFGLVSDASGNKDVYLSTR